jgi:heptaprenylglyceryl phosphate synthase
MGKNSTLTTASSNLAAYNPLADLILRLHTLYLHYSAKAGREQAETGWTE